MLVVGRSGEHFDAIWFRFSIGGGVMIGLALTVVGKTITGSLSMFSAGKSVGLGLAGSVVVAILGLGWCLYLQLAKVVTPWFWVAFVVLLVAVSAGFGLEVHRKKTAPSPGRAGLRRPRVFALGQLALIYGVITNMASLYCGRVLHADLASGLLVALAVTLLVVAAVTLYRASRGGAQREVV